MLEDVEEREGNSSGQNKSWSEVTLAVEPPYWRLPRNGNRYFVAPKTEHQHVKREHDEEEMWVRDESAADVFLAIGWLVEKIQDGQAQTTRYACTLNISTDPVSMWLIYDYRQPNDHGYLRTSNVPTVEEPDLYLDPADDCRMTPSTAAEPAAAMGQEGGQEKYNGYMDQPVYTKTPPETGPKILLPLLAVQKSQQLSFLTAPPTRNYYARSE